MVEEIPSESGKASEPDEDQGLPNLLHIDFAVEFQREFECLLELLVLILITRLSERGSLKKGHRSM